MLCPRIEMVAQHYRQEDLPNTPPAQWAVFLVILMSKAVIESSFSIATYLFIICYGIYHLTCTKRLLS